MIRPMQIAPAAHVTVRYSVALDEEPAPDCTADGQQTEFITGKGQILPGLEAKLAGHSAGERLDLTLAPAEAFGERDPALELRVPLSDFPDNARSHIKPGVRFRGPHPGNPEQVVAYTVQELAGDEVVASGNHPHAGRSLRVSVEVLAVREATEDELSGGCCGGGGCGSGSCGEGSCGSGGCGEHSHAHEGGCGSGGCGCH